MASVLKRLADAELHTLHTRACAPAPTPEALVPPQLGAGDGPAASPAVRERREPPTRLAAAGGVAVLALAVGWVAGRATADWPPLPQAPVPAPAPLVTPAMVELVVGEVHIGDAPEQTAASAPPAQAGPLLSPAPTLRTQQVALAVSSVAAGAQEPVPEGPEVQEPPAAAPQSAQAPAEALEHTEEAAATDGDAEPAEEPAQAGDDDAELEGLLAALPSAPAEEGGSAAPAPAARQAPSVYVPPAPSAQELPETLAREQVLEVVLSGSEEVAACVQAQAPGAQTAPPTLVAQWTIRPDGSIAGVEVEPASLRDSELARCVVQRISRWRFPAHRAQMGPIRFPFTLAAR